MEKILPNSSWNFTPLPKQVRALAKLRAQLGLPETDYPKTRWEIRNLIYELRRKRNGITGK